MNTARCLWILVGFTVALPAQTKSGSLVTTRPRQPAGGTRIGPHRLGETFNEWLAIEQIDLDATCHDQQQTFVAEQPSSPPPPDVDFSRDDYVQMLRAKAIWEGDKHDKEQAAILKNLMEFERHNAATFLCDDLHDIRDTGNGDYRDLRGLTTEARIEALHNDNGYVDKWSFANGKLVAKQSIYTTEITAKELGFLKEAYGPPASITKLPRQNAFGVKWNDILIMWHLPDGTTLHMKALGGPKDDLVVTFISKAYANRPASREPNPYLSNKP